MTPDDLDFASTSPRPDPHVEADLRERIADGVLARCPHGHPDHNDQQPCGDCVRLAARIARGQA